MTTGKADTAQIRRLIHQAQRVLGRKPRDSETTIVECGQSLIARGVV